MVSEYLNELDKDMKAAVEAVRQLLATVRTGRASPQLIENVQVHVTSYGTTMPLKQLATITAPDARLLVVSPWDKSTVADVEKAIRSADLGLNPNSDGQVVRVPIPPLTGERRQELVKLVRKYAEEGRIRVRRVRREYRELFSQLEADKEISQDELSRLLDKVQKATDAAISKVDEICAAKEKEILEG